MAVLPETTRIALFIFGCIPTRIAIIASVFLGIYSQIAAILLISIGIGFGTLFLTKSRLNAPEGGGNTWWAAYRPLLSILYLTSGIAVMHQRRKLAAVLLSIDLGLGILLFIREHTQ